ncbi:MAG: TlpA disulfide reductase family protein [Acetobacteraceae bacterium]|nr:TlpA disulfide reductase family protein [Acetobacteraceae bacterium]
MTPIKRRILLSAAGATLPAALLQRKLLAAPHATVPSLEDVPPTAAPVPDIQFMTADGTAKTLKDYAGKGVVLNFWATWCVPCVAEMPALAKLATLVDPAHVAILPLSSDRAGAAAVRRFFDEKGIEGLPILLDPRGDAARAFGSRGIPTTVLIDARGRERARLEGAADWADPSAVAAVKELAKG